MNLNFDEMTRYVALESAYQDICMESLGSEAHKIDTRLAKEILSYDAEYTRAMNTGDYQKVIDICDKLMDAIDEAERNLKALNPGKNHAGVHIFAAVLLLVGGIVTLGATPYFMEASAKGFAALIKKLAGRTVGTVGKNAVMATTAAAGAVGGTVMTFKGYLDLIKYAIAPRRSEFGDDPHAHNVDYRLAAQGIKDTREIIKGIRENTLAYMKEKEGKATESDLSLLMEAACEAIDPDELYLDPAMESLGSESRKAQKELIKKGREIYGRLAAAYNSGDYDATVRCLDELEKTVTEYESKLNSMKAEGIISKTFGAVASLAIIVLGAIAIFKSNTFTIPLMGALGKVVKLITGGIGMSAAAGITTGGLMVGNFTASMIGFGMIQKVITKAVAARNGKRDNPDDPRYANGDYAAAQEIVKELKALINRSRVEAMSLKRAQPQMA